MKKVTLNELKSIQGGSKTHYHWKCTVGLNYTSVKYNSWNSATKAAQKQINKYNTHVTKTSVFGCEC